MGIANRIMLLLLLASFSVQGCALMKAPPSGTASAGYSNGVLTVTYEGDVLKTFAASRAALKDFNMTINSALKDSTGGVIDAKRPDGTTTVISLREKGREKTIVAIKVGAFGDEEYSRAVSRRIEAHLKD